MEENDKQQNQKSNGDIDRFSQFFFGKSTHRESYSKGENDSQVLSEQKEQWSYDDRYNRYNDWFFGVKRNEQNEQTPSPQNNQNHIENIINNVDFELLMETIDMLVTTTQPLIKEITPFVHRFIKKFKSD